MKKLLLWLLPFVVIQYVTGNAPLPWAEKPAETEIGSEAGESADPAQADPPAIEEQAGPVQSVGSAPEKLGFETGNIGSGERGPICADADGNVFFIDNWGPGLWKRTPDGELIRLNEDHVSCLNALDGWIYYIAADKETASVVRIRPDGSERQVLAKHAEIDHLIAAESGLIYEAFSYEQPMRICRMPLDGGEETVLTEGGALISAYYDGVLYLSEGWMTEGRFFSVRLSDGKVETISDESVAVYAAADGEGLFYVPADLHYHFVDARTGEETVGRQLWQIYHYDGGFLYRYDYAPGNTRIVLIKVDLRSGEEETVLRLSDRLFTPDGRETEAPFSAFTIGGGFPEDFDMAPYRDERDGIINLRMEWIDNIYTVGGRIVCQGKLREAAEKTGVENCIFAVGGDGTPEYWG